MQQIDAETIAGGIAFIGEQMPGYHTATMMIRLEGGMVSERESELGLACILEQTLDKGTATRSDREYADAFDAIGARQAVYTGRQSWVMVISSLPEHLPAAIDLCGEMMLTATFPDEAVRTAISLAEQELFSLEDSPRAILRKQMVRQAYGPVLGRHMLGERETLSSITADRVREHWQACRGKDRLSCAVAGNYDDGLVRAAIERSFGPMAEHSAPPPSTEPVFDAASCHISKDLEQTQIGLSFPAVAYDSPDFATEKVLLGVLSGGMSSRLFTEVREKQGLVYWVGAWHEQPRGYGMIHVGAATRPDRARRTHDTLLREIARLEEDLDETELQRAKVGLIADNVTSGSSVQQRANDLLVDHFHLGHALSAESKVQAIRDVSTDDIRRYLAEHPRDELSVVTVGKHALAESEEKQ